jgi:hypothetical protein
MTKLKDAFRNFANATSITVYFPFAKRIVNKMATQDAYLPFGL